MTKLIEMSNIMKDQLILVAIDILLINIRMISTQKLNYKKYFIIITTFLCYLNNILTNSQINLILSKQFIFSTSLQFQSSLSLTRSKQLIILDLQIYLNKIQQVNHK
ncbi:transmembrane protein, putative (macronuclear) [Tetrahymena thermophila SB210]|uniref:Transmembrane protein, putative n=1 Tax=Tetrahymena thermophila (strain SB210) TaxID=312017 RepID=W7WZR6_TETTS|nr:transmembrane protein, putative [Tetrahymena thermophila SB210]EWS71097.1 transmembrane protein, putative [Tetrahymena thermophila SB210]|eukprot:XP_012656396.1 transmembrane protein, putative [Tetrahymena thermophila SB210]